MSQTYMTKQGDMWDSIAHSQLGGVKHTDALVNENREHIGVFVFSSGVTLMLPDVSQSESNGLLPPWKQAQG